MGEFLVLFFGKPLGIIIFQLCVAMQFTVYLSLIAFLGGGVLGSIVTVLRIYPVPILNFFSSSYIWFFQSSSNTACTCAYN